MLIRKIRVPNSLFYFALTFLMKKFLLIILVFWCFIQISKAQETNLNIKNPKDIFLIENLNSSKYSLKGYVSLLCDSLGKLNIQEVSSLKYDTLFKKANDWNTAVLLSPKMFFWIKITLQNNTEENYWRIGSLERYNNIAYYSPDNTHFYTGKSGMNYKPSERNIPYHLVSNYSVPIFLTKKPQNIYVKISSISSQNITATKDIIKGFLDKFYVITNKKMEMDYSAEMNFDSLFFGVCLCMLFYNLFIFFFVKDKSYLYYSISILGVIMYFVFFSGYYVAVLFDLGVSRWERDISDILSAFFADISIFFFLSFSQIFLFANQKNTTWYKIIFYLKWYLLIANGVFKGILLLLNNFAYDISTLFHNINYGVTILILILLCVYLWKNKTTIRLYYVYANLPFFTLIIAYIFNSHLYIDRDKPLFLLDNSFQMGIMLQIISFSIALAARINFMRQDIEQKKLDNEQLNHRLLRTQMNPHFIFNSLGSIQNYLFENDTKQTVKYLNNFSKLMRRILENSREDFVFLEKEIQTLETYCMLQKMRFGENLIYSINISPDIDVEEIQIPPMFAQPFIENSIEHGFVNRATENKIEVNFSLSKDIIILEIKDNGLGLEHTKNTANKPKKEHQSLATRITQERLELLRQKTQLPLVFDLQEIISANNEVLGTSVKIELPYKISF